MLRPKISVIIPAFQQGAYLYDCINSLVTQSQSDWEAIIVDDGSTDNTAAVSQEIVFTENRVRYFKKANGGVSSARNYGLAVAQGEFIQFLDADDQLEKGKLGAHLSYLLANPTVDIVYGNAKYFKHGIFDLLARSPDPLTPELDWIQLGAEDSRDFFTKLLERNIFPVCAPLCRRSAIDKIGYFNESLASHEDWEFWLRAARQELVFHYYSSLASDSLIRIHPLSLSQDRSAMLLTMYSIRLAYHNRIASRTLRITNLTNLIWLSSTMDSNTRSERRRTILNICRSQFERIYVRSAFICAVDGYFYPAIRRILPFFPSRLRRVFGLRSTILK